MVGLATLATIVASQAVISGSFSLTAQAIQLGYLPRMQIIHTSSRQEGQIYVPAVNWALMIACIFLVLEFRDSSGLASAYGIAVTGTMAVTTLPVRADRARAATAGSPPARSCAGFLVDRPHPVRREPAQDAARRRLPARDRARAVHDHDDLEARHGPAQHST